jgi:hypothetical protein
MRRVKELEALLSTGTRDQVSCRRRAAAKAEADALVHLALIAWNCGIAGGEGSNEAG